MKQLKPLHPGEMLREEYMKPCGLTAYTLAQRLGVPRAGLERLVREQQGISVDMALRLSRYFRTTPRFWLNLQIQYELEMWERDTKAMRAIKRIREITAEATEKAPPALCRDGP